jgi:Domain of unknown function (DUF3854)
MMQTPLCYQYLSERGITDDTVKLYGLELNHRVSSKIAKDRLGRSLSRSYIEYIYILIPDENGNATEWIARPLPTIENQPKFVCPVGSHGPAYIPKPVFKLACGEGIIVTEAPIKALAVQQTGFDCVGINGVWGAAVENAKSFYVITRQLQQALEWRGRKVYLAPDADLAINPKVRHAVETDEDGTLKITRFLSRAEALASNSRLAQVRLQSQSVRTLKPEGGSL